MDELERRHLLLADIDGWRERGLVDDAERDFLRARVRAGPRDPALAAYATQSVGGLLLGAALVSVVQFFVPLSPWQPLCALAIAAACILAAYVAERQRGERVAEAGFAAGLVAAGAVPFFLASPPPFGAIAALLVVGVTLARGGRSPLALLAVPAFFVGARHATGADMLRGNDLGAEAVFLLALVAYAILLARQRHERWASYALALHGVALTLATFPLLDSWGTTDAGLAALAAGATLGLLFGVGLKLDARPLVATSGALLAFAAASFAFLALGPALAALVLLCMGAALVWQADHVRVYLRPRGRDALR